MCLGCDVHQGGCNNVGPSKLNVHIKNSIKESLEINDFMMGLIATKLNASLDIVKIYLDAIMYGPHNELSVDKTNRVETYEHLHNEPSTLSSYL